MDIIYWLIPLSIIILMIAVAIFFWAVGNGQYHDLDAAAAEILFENDSPSGSNTTKNTAKNIETKSITLPKKQSNPSQTNPGQSSQHTENYSNGER